MFLWQTVRVHTCSRQNTQWKGKTWQEPYLITKNTDITSNSHRHNIKLTSCKIPSLCFSYLARTRMCRWRRKWSQWNIPGTPRPCTHIGSGPHPKTFGPCLCCSALSLQCLGNGIYRNGGHTSANKGWFFQLFKIMPVWGTLPAWQCSY